MAGKIFQIERKDGELSIPYPDINHFVSQNAMKGDWIITVTDYNERFAEHADDNEDGTMTIFGTFEGGEFNDFFSPTKGRLCLPGNPQRSYRLEFHSISVIRSTKRVVSDDVSDECYDEYSEPRRSDSHAWSGSYVSGSDVDEVAEAEYQSEAGSFYSFKSDETIQQEDTDEIQPAPRAMPHKEVFAALAGADKGDLVSVDWQLGKERGSWSGSLVKRSRAAWSVVYDLGDRELPTLIPSPDVVYYSVTTSKPIREVRRTSLPIPSAGKLVAFRYARPGSTWHFGEVRSNGEIVMRRRIYDGVVKPMGEALAVMNDIVEVVPIRRFPAFGSTWNKPVQSSSQSQPVIPPNNATPLPPAPLPRPPPQPHLDPSPDEFEALLEFTHGDLTASNVVVPPQPAPNAHFQPRHLLAPQVADLKGGFLRSLTIVPHDPRMLPHKALAKTTVAAHKRILRQLSQISDDLLDKWLDEALVSFFTRLRNLKRIRWSTMVTKMATAHGALRP